MSNHGNEPIRTGWRRLSWHGTYSPMLGISLGPDAASGFAELPSSLVVHLPLPENCRTTGLAVRLLEESRRRDMVTVLAPATAWWEMTSGNRWSWLRRWATLMSRHPQAMFQLALPPPTPDGTEGELLVERAVDEFHHLAPMTPIMGAPTRTGEAASGLRLARLADLALQDIGAPRSRELTLPLLGLPHDRPALGLVHPGGASPWRSLHWALGASMAGVILQVPPRARTLERLDRLARFLAETAELAGADPAQEEVTVLVTGCSAATLAPVETALRALAALGVGARISRADDPLSLDKQRVIILPSPRRLTPGVAALLLRRAHLGARVVITGTTRPVGAGEISPAAARAFRRQGTTPWGRGAITVFDDTVERQSTGRAIELYRGLIPDLLPHLVLQDPGQGMLVRPWRTARGWGLAAWTPPGSRCRLNLPHGGSTLLPRGGGHLLVGREDELLARIPT